MFLSRKLGKVFRGRATRLQIVLGALLGTMLAFIPGFAFPDGSGGGFSQAPGLILFLATLALVLDSNVAILGLSLLVGKLLSIPLLPVSFEIGTWLLDGPTEGLFRFLVNSPATAWFGLEYYSVTGGLALGTVVGLGIGFGLWRSIDGLRKKLADLDENSERWQTITEKRWVRFVTWVLLGKGKGKKRSWEEISERARTKKRPVRWAGAAVVVVLFAGLGFAHDYFGSTWFERTARVGMTQWNGATADLGSARLDLVDGRLTMSDLALADERDLDTDSFRARALDLNLATGALLSKRVVVDRLAITQAEAGSQRSTKASRLGDEDEAPGPGGADGGAGDVPIPEDEESSTRGLEEIVEDVELWRGRLRTAQTWIERLFGDDPEAGEENDANSPTAEVFGLATVVASHLLQQEPRFLVRELLIEDLTAAAFGDTSWSLTGSNLSSNPELVDQPARLSITSSDQHSAIELQRATDGTVSIDCRLSQMSVDALKGSMPWLPLDGGTFDFQLRGALGFGPNGLQLDLPLSLMLHDTQMTIGGTTASLESLEIPAEVRGPFAGPAVHVDTSLLLQRLKAAGADALVGNLASEFGIDATALRSILDGELDAETLKNAGQNLLDQSGLGTEAERAAEEAANRLRGLLPGGGRRR